MNNIKNRAEEIVFDEIAEKILKNVPKQNQKYVQKQLDELCYWNEKYYRNGFIDGYQIAMSCFEE